MYATIMDLHSSTSTPPRPLTNVSAYLQNQVDGNLFFTSTIDIHAGILTGPLDDFVSIKFYSSTQTGEHVSVYTNTIEGAIHYALKYSDFLVIRDQNGLLVYSDASFETQTARAAELLNLTEHSSMIPRFEYRDDPAKNPVPSAIARWECPSCRTAWILTSEVVVTGTNGGVPETVYRPFSIVISREMVNNGGCTLLHIDPTRVQERFHQFSGNYSSAMHKSVAKRNH